MSSLVWVTDHCYLLGYVVQGSGAWIAPTIVSHIHIANSALIAIARTCRCQQTEIDATVDTLWSRDKVKWT
jgi:hypothetical protein